MSKSAVKLTNSSKNKLNNELIYNFNSHPNTQLVPIWGKLKHSASAFQNFFFFFHWEACFNAFQWVPCTVYGTHKPLSSTKFSLKMSHAVLFTYLKIILLPYFQFSIFSKINGIQTVFKNYFVTIFTMNWTLLIYYYCVYRYVNNMCGKNK